MPIYFYPNRASFPLSLDSVGNCWEQTPVSRPDGYFCYHWLQTEKGCGEVRIDNQKLLLAENQGILIAPFIPHSYHGAAPSWTTCFATFNGKMISGMQKVIGRQAFYLAGETPQFSFRNWVDRMVEDRNMDEVRSSIECYTFFMNFTGFAQYHQQQHPLYRQYILPVTEEIENNYSQDLTAQSLAGQFFISSQYLNRLFQRFLGRSTYQYILEIRIKHAKELLANNPEMDVQQISSLAGFNDASHFCKTFKRHTGYTPLEFRKLLR